MKNVSFYISITLLVFQPKKAGYGFLQCQMPTERVKAVLGLQHTLAWEGSLSPFWLQQGAQLIK